MPRNRPIIIAAIVAVVVVFTSLRGVAGFYTDYLWFDQLRFGRVFTGILGAKVLLAVVFMLLFFVLALANLTVADRIGTRFPRLGPQDELVQRYRDAVGRHAPKVRPAVAGLFALFLGLGQSSLWNEWILYRHARPFHVRDPQFHRDVGFYVFKLPFYQSVVSWLFGALVVTTLLTAAFHYLNGGIRIQASGPGPRVTPQVKAHLSVLLGALALIKALGYWYQRYGLVLAQRHRWRGATYTDVHAQLPALRLLFFISLIAFFLFIANIRLRGWTLPVLGVGLWFLISIAAGAIYPAIVQRYSVQPVENKRELPYIRRNIAATRDALLVNHVQDKPFQYNENLGTQDLVDNAKTIRNVRLWDPDPSLTPKTYQQLQEIRSYYKFTSSDIDRYPLGGILTQTVIALRELNQADLPSNSWVSRHLQYTHGYGAVLAPSNAVTAEGRPVFDIRDIPPDSSGSPDGTPAITRPQVYFGESTPNFSIVGTRQDELDYQRPDGSNQVSHYDGRGGVRLSSWLRRLAFSARFGDINVLISSAVTSKSRVLYIRDVADRVHKAAPFLHLDADPYPVILDGRLVWVQDAYTVTNRYPYGQQADANRLPANSGLHVSFNYIRNSVKATVDAYDGTVKLYVFDDKDPILHVYARAFPNIFLPRAAMPPGLLPHLRYPEDLFRVQTTMFGKYHITDPASFYIGADQWNVAQDPGVGPPNQLPARTQVTTASGQIISIGQVRREDPYYLLMRLPKESDESFIILQPFVPISVGDKQQNMTGFMIAKSDPSDYGTLEAYHMPEGQLVAGPAQIDARIQQDPTVSRDVSLLNTQGSEADFGNIITIPVNQSLLYIRPLYVKSARNPIPEFKKAIVVYAGKIAYADTLQDALSQIFPGAPLLTQEQRTGGAATLSGAPSPAAAATLTVAQLLAQAQADFAAADAALKKGDLATYQAKIEEAHRLIDQAVAELAAATGGPPPANTATTAPASSA